MYRRTDNNEIKMCASHVHENKIVVLAIILIIHGVERGTTSDAFLGGGENERCGNFKVSILSLINFSF